MVAVAKQQTAIAKAAEQIDNAEGEIEKLRKAVPLAEEADTKRAASSLKSARGSVAIGWSADAARLALEGGEERQKMVMRAKERLEAELRDLEDDLATADNAVAVAIKNITKPTVEKLVAQARADRQRFAMNTAILAVLTASEKAPEFHNFLRARAAEDRRDAPLAELKKEVERLQYATNADSFDETKRAVAAWSVALAALRQNPGVALPGEGD